MYYKEVIIDGETFYKLSPNGELNLSSNKALTKQLEEAMDEIYTLKENIENLLDRLDNLEN